jgi:Domain of unknown function (DUF397)
VFSIDLPTWLGDIIGVLAGGTWPKEDEGDFAAVSDIWDQTTAGLGGFTDVLNDCKQTMLEGLSGPTGEQFAEFIDNLQTALPQMQQGTQALSQLSMETALNIQYAKLMMLTNLIITAVTIAELADSVFGAAAIPAVEAAAEVVMESIASQLIKQVLKSAAEAAVMQTGMDSGIQLFQYLKYGKPWNWKQTVESAGLGALGGALGGAMGIGAIRGLGEDIGNSLGSHVVQGAINGAALTGIGNAINGGDANVGLGAAGGAIGGAVGHIAHTLGGGSGAEPKPGGYNFKDPEFGDGTPGGKFTDDDNLGDGPNAFALHGGPGASSNGARNGATNGFPVSGGPAHDDFSDSDSISDQSFHDDFSDSDSISDQSSHDDFSDSDSIRSFSSNDDFSDGDSFVSSLSSHDDFSDGDSFVSSLSSHDGDSIYGDSDAVSINDASLRSDSTFGNGSPVTSSTVSQGPALHGSPQTIPPEQVVHTPSTVSHGAGDPTQTLNDPSNNLVQRGPEPPTVPQTPTMSRDPFSTSTPSTTTTGPGGVVTHESSPNPVQTPVQTPRTGGVQGLPGFEVVVHQQQPQTTDRTEPQALISAPPTQRTTPPVTSTEPVPPVERTPSTVSSVGSSAPDERPSSVVSAPESVVPSVGQGESPAPIVRQESPEPPPIVAAQDPRQSVEQPVQGPPVGTSRDVTQPTDNPALGDRPESPEADTPPITVPNTESQTPPVRTSEPPTEPPVTPLPVRESSSPVPDGQLTPTPHEQLEPEPHEPPEQSVESMREQLARMFSGDSDDDDAHSFDDGASDFGSDFGDDPPIVELGNVHVPMLVLSPYKAVEGHGARPDADDVRDQYGIPFGNQRKLQDYATNHGLVLVVRPTNPASVSHLEDGALPKPQEIKAKTINDLDVRLGAPEHAVGLVGYFRPELPPRSERPDGPEGPDGPDGHNGPDDDATWNALVSRFNQRNREYDELAPKMQTLEGDGDFKVVDKVVHQLDGQGQLRPIAGDHDIYDLVRLDGRSLEPGDYDAEIEHLIQSDAGIMHGAHRYWEPTTEFDQQISDKVVASHQPGGEPLVAYAPRPQRAEIVDPDTGESHPYDDGTEFEPELPELVHPDPDHAPMSPGAAPRPFRVTNPATRKGPNPDTDFDSDSDRGSDTDSDSIRSSSNDSDSIRGSSNDSDSIRSFSTDSDSIRSFGTDSDADSIRSSDSDQDDDRDQPSAPHVPTESPDVRTAPHSVREQSDTPPDERSANPHGHTDTDVQRHEDHGTPVVHHVEPAFSEHVEPTGPSRSEQWEDAKAELQQHYTDRFDYTAKTERVANEAEDHFQEYLTDRDILRSRGDLDPADLSQAGQDKVLSDFKADVKDAFDKQFGTPDDRYDTAVDHVNAFHDTLDSLARELPDRLHTEAVWEQQRDLLRQQFDQAFDGHPSIAPRRQLFGRLGDDRIASQRDDAWQQLQPELRKAFDETAARTDPADLSSAVSDRFDELMHDQIPKGIALHDRLLTEVSAGRAATGEEHSPVDDAIEKRITSEFESVFGKPFAARPDDALPFEDDFDRNDRWEDIKNVQQSEWIPKLIALNKELGPGYTDRFDTIVGSRADNRAELGLNLEKPFNNPEHGLTYDKAVSRPSAGTDDGGHDDADDTDHTDVENPPAAAPRDDDAWLPGRDVSDAGLERVRSAFASELADAFHQHFGGPVTGDREDAWQGRRDALFADRVPKLLEYEAAYEHHLKSTAGDFDEAFDDWEEDLVGGGHLGDDGIERVRAKFDEDLRSAYDQIHQADPDRWAEFGGPEGAWHTVSQGLLRTAEDRFEDEQGLVREVGQAADRFDQLGNSFEVEQEHAQELGSAYRTDTATRYDELYSDGSRDVSSWLEHEKEHGDAFGSRLTDLSDQREAAAAAERAEAERAAAAQEEAARAAEAAAAGHHGDDAGQQVQEEVRREPPPETGAEKLQRLSAENHAKAEGDVQQLTRIWRDEGRPDALIERASKAWNDAVNREFDSFHHGLAENGRVLTSGKWQDKYDNLVEVGRSEQWIGVHKQVGDAMSALEDGLKQRTEEWSGSRYADWQREQLASAGQRLASGMRNEMRKQLDYLQIGRADSVPEDTRRQWTAEAVTKGYDDVLNRLRRDTDTSPVLLASLEKLRADTVTALDAPGHAWDLAREPELSGASEDERWQQEQTQLDSKYAQQLDVLAKLESKRPDADAIYERIVGVGRDRSGEGLEEYEQLLPGPEQFRQAFDQSFDQAFVPLVRNPDMGVWGKSSAEQRWNEQRALLENTLSSRAQIAAKQVELAERAARTAQQTRESWVSAHPAQEKAIDQALDEFRANQKQLFLGTYGRLDGSGKIDVNSSYSYKDSYDSLVGSLDEKIAAAVTVARDPEVKAASAEASAKYDEAVDAWRESHGPALSSFEPVTTVGVRHSPPDDEFTRDFAPDREAQFEAAFAAQAASASARHLDQLRTETLGGNRSGRSQQPSYAATGRPRGTAAKLNAKLDLEGRFVEAMPRLQDTIRQAVRGTGGLDDRAVQSLVRTSIARADAVFNRISRRAEDQDGLGDSLQRELDDVIAGTKAVAEFHAAVAEQVKSFAEDSADQLPAQAVAHVVQWAHNAADAKFDQLLSSGHRVGEARITALSNRLDEALNEIDGRLEFEAGAQKAISSAVGKAAQIAEEKIRASRTALDPDSVQRLQLQHFIAAQKAADRVRDDLAAHHFDPEHTQQVFEDLDDTLQHLVGGVREQVLVEARLTSALTHAGNGFAALTDAHHEVPAKAFAGAAKNYRDDYLTAHIRTFSAKPLDVSSWLDHESVTADRFNTALHAPVREAAVDWSRNVQDEPVDFSPWRKSSFSPVGADATCVEAVPVSIGPRRRAVRGAARDAARRPVSPRHPRTPAPRRGPSAPAWSRAALSAYPAPTGAVGEWNKCAMSGILEAVEVVFIDGADVPVKHKYADRMVVMRGEGEGDGPGLYYTADEWQAFILGVKEGEFDDMAAGTQAPDDAQRVIALRDSKDPDGPKLILALEAWTELLITIKAGERELPTDMRELLDERFH